MEFGIWLESESKSEMTHMLPEGFEEDLLSSALAHGVDSQRLSMAKFMANFEEGYDLAELVADDAPEPGGIYAQMKELYLAQLLGNDYRDR